MQFPLFLQQFSSLRILVARNTVYVSNTARRILDVLYARVFPGTRLTKHVIKLVCFQRVKILMNASRKMEDVVRPALTHSEDLSKAVICFAGF